MAAPSPRPPTFQELCIARDSERLEIIDGAVIEKVAPSTAHAFTESRLAAVMGPFNRRPGGSRGPGGWWLCTEVHVSYPGGEVYCHDTAGWRRDRVPQLPTEWPVAIRADWVCEIASPRHERSDLVVKPRTLHAAQVPHYWVINPEERMLLVHRWSPEGYVVVQRATSGDVIRAEPFEAIELHVGDLFGDEED